MTTQSNYNLIRATVKAYQSNFKMHPTAERWGYLMEQAAQTYRTRKIMSGSIK